MLLRALLLMLVAANALAQAKPERVVFATNWKAQAEHGGYYQALAAGGYRACGLEVEIQMGGPQVNNRPLLLVGKIDFLMGGNLLQAFDAVKQKVPTLIVAAHFQRDPQGIMAHPGGYESFDTLKKAPVILVSAYGVTSFFQWMKQAHGFREEQVRPYQFSLAPFLVNKNWAVQAYLTAEPLAAEREGKIKPKFFLLADHGWSSYSTTVETRADLVAKKPQLVQCFVDASAAGWVNYLYGDRKAANAAIRKHNPEMDEATLEYSVGKMKEFGIVDSGDALTQGIGAMSDARIADFHAKMVAAGLFKPGEIDPRRAYSLQFVNKGAALAELKRLRAK